MNSPHPLDKVLHFLEGRHEDRQAAIRLLKEFIYKDLMGQDPNNLFPYKMLDAVLTHCIKPVFRGDMEKQGQVDRLLEMVRDLPVNTSFGDPQELLGGLQFWLMALLDSQSTAGQARNATHKLVTMILNQFPMPPDMTQRTTHFLQAGESLSNADFWKEINQICHLLQTVSKDFRQAWEEERQTFFRLVSELALHMEEMRQNTGGLGRRLGDAINRIKEGQNLEELQQMRILLVREAEDLKLSTHQMHQRLADSQSLLATTQARLEQLEAELLAARAEGMTDPLTGVLNRRAFDKCLEREYARHLRTGTALSVVMFDLDHFKRVNDTYGHPVGDKVLITVSNRAGQTLRQSDVIARYGGEEFILLLPETDMEEASQVTRRVREAVLKLRFKTKSDTLTVTASFGIASLKPGMNTAQLVKLADEALYKAKMDGRNRAVRADRMGS